MAFPTTLSAYTGNETLLGAGHSAEHNALERKLGIDSSTDIHSIDYRVRALELSLFNVKTYGAVGDGITDDTHAIQLAINAAHNQGGGVVYFPGAIYRITDDLTPYSSLSFKGVGMESSIIKQESINKNGFRGDGLSSIIMEDLGIIGNGAGTIKGTGIGKGIYLTYGSNGNNPFHNFRNVMVRNFGSDGIYIQTGIVCNFEKVYTAYNGGNGFFWPEGGTSCLFNACWARENALAGWKFLESVYINLSGCAADNNGISYMVLDAQSIGFFGCGSEGALKNGGLYNGYGWYIDNSSVITLESCWVTDNRNLGVWVTNGANGIKLNVADNTPNATATNFIKVDSGCIATIAEQHNSTANSLAAQTTTILNDGSGTTTVKALILDGTSGKLTVTAASDGGDYNIGSQNGAQTLALFGSGGANSLSLNLLDGKLIVSTAQTPASAAATGTAGTIAWDSSFIYVCVATNTWKRVAIATW